MVGPGPSAGGSWHCGRIAGGQDTFGAGDAATAHPGDQFAVLFSGSNKRGAVGLSLASGTFVLAATMYVLISRGFNPSWLGFVSSGFDVTLITAALGLFLLTNQPHTAVNSK